MTRTFVVDDTLGFLRVPALTGGSAGGREIPVTWRLLRPAQRQRDRARRGRPGRPSRARRPAAREAGDQRVDLGRARAETASASTGRYVVRVVATSVARTRRARRSDRHPQGRRPARVAFRGDAGRQRPDRDHRGRHRRDRRLRPVRRLRADADRRRVPGGERGRDGLCGRRRLRRVRRPVRDALRLRVRRRVSRLRRDGDGRDGRLPRSARSAAGRSATTSAGRGSSSTGDGCT